PLGGKVDPLAEEVQERRGRWLDEARGHGAILPHGRPPAEAGPGAWEDGSMRVLVAPDSFAGTLTAPQAAEAIARGWRRAAPDDEVITCPLADGGPGLVAALHATLGGELSS